jgi:hypothetical protein
MAGLEHVTHRDKPWRIAAHACLSSPWDQSRRSASDPTVSRLPRPRLRAAPSDELGAALAAGTKGGIQFPKSALSLRPTVRRTRGTRIAAAGFVQRPAIPPPRRRIGWQSKTDWRHVVAPGYRDRHPLNLCLPPVAVP